MLDPSVLPPVSFTIDSTGPSVTASPPGGTFGAAGTSVTLSSESGALIFFTTDGTEPTAQNPGTPYSAAIPITVTTTLKAIAKDALNNFGPVMTEVYTVDSTGPTVTATPATSTFGPAGTSVELKSNDADLAKIYYTTDGSDPADPNNANRIEYSAAISITTTTTLKFIGYDTVGNAGAPGEEVYTLDNTGPTVTATPATSTFGPAGTSVELKSNDADLAKIYYTTDGSDPADPNNANRIEYSAAISITTTTTLKFIGYDTVGNAGAPGEEVYTLDNTGPTVTATPATSTFGPAGTSVELKSNDADLAKIYYTTDGSDPADPNNANRIEYSAAISITTTTTLKFIGYDTVGNAGAPGEEVYTLDNTGPTVTATPATSTFGPAGTSVELKSNDADLAKIYYTTDGSDPDDPNNANRIEYLAAISITTTTTLKFIGYDTVGNAGAPGEEVYTLDNTGPTVTATPATSTFGPAGTSVELKSNDADLAKIYYTTDGSDPADPNNANRIEYSAAISITTTTTLKFIGYDTVGNAGAPGEEVYTLDNTGPTVTATPPGGTFATAQSVTLGSQTADLADIFFTTDGSTPDSGDTKYTGAIQITTTTNLKFIGYDTVGNAGPVGSETYTIQTATSIDTSISLQLSGNNKITPGSTFTASGKLINAVADSPIAGKPITFTIDGSSVGGTVNTDSKGKFSVQLTAPTAIGKHDVQAHFAGGSQYNPSDSPVRKLTVQSASSLLLLLLLVPDTSLSLKLEGKDKVTTGSTYSVSGKLIDSVSKKPISGKTISVTTDGGSPKASDTTDGKGEFDVSLKAPDSYGKHDIQAHFSGDSQYKSSESPVSKITVEGSTLTLKNEKTTVTTDEQPTDKQQPDEQQPDEQQPDEQQPDEQQPDEQQPDEQQPDEQQPDEQHQMSSSQMNSSQMNSRRVNSRLDQSEQI